LVLEALSDLQVRPYINLDLHLNYNSEPNQVLINYIAQSNTGRTILQHLVAYEKIEIKENFSDIDLNGFRWDNFKGDNNYEQIKAMLFYLGALTLSNTKGFLIITNPATRRLIKKAYLQKFQTSRDMIDIFYKEGNIGHLLQYMESTGLYKSLKPETFSQQNEIAPQAMFVALVNLDASLTIFEEHIRDPDCWIDCYSECGNLINIIEWKNVQLDYLFVPGAKNKNPYTSQDRSRKANILRCLPKNDVWNLKKVSWDNYQPDQTMIQIVEDAFKNQAKPYAVQIQKNHPNQKIVIHVALSVGTSHILYKTYTEWINL